jgi:antitoxin component YwqK of YwqJK toxin-antitoxin module
MKNLLFILLFIPFIGLGQSIIIPAFANVNNQEKVNYWENGQKLSEVQYFDEKRDGSCKYWYKNGQLMSSGLYMNGKMYGPFISYYENGQIQSQGNYNYNESGIYSRKDGVWKYYYENGKIESESIIKNGVEELKFYDKEGNLLPEGEGC